MEVSITINDGGQSVTVNKRSENHYSNTVQDTPAQKSECVDKAVKMAKKAIGLED